MKSDQNSSSLVENQASKSSQTTKGTECLDHSQVSSGQTDKLGLEDIVHLANKVGLEFVNAKKDADRLELLKNTIRSRVILRIDDGQSSEAKLKRQMEVDPEYLQYVDKLVNARAEADKLRVRYESYKNLFDARRSLLSYQKAELKLV